jgi:hypothetical protein
MEAFAPIDTIIPMFLDAGKNSNDYLGNIAYGFFQVAAWAAIFWAFIRVTVGADSPEGGAAQLVGWFLKIFVLGTIGAFLLPTIIPALIEGALSIGTGVSGSTMSAADFLMPSRLAITGWTEVEKLMKHAMSRCNGLYSCATSSISLVYYLIASIVVLFSFVAMIIMIILSYVYFVMEAIGTLIMLGWMAAEKTAWMGRGGFATLTSRFVQMIMLSASLSIGTGLFELVRMSGEPSIVQAVVAAVVALIIAILAFKSEQIGSSIVGGMPGVQTNQTAGGVMSAAGGLIAGGAVAAASMARSAMPGSSGSGTPPSPTPRDGSPGGGPQGGNGQTTGAGHGSNPFGPSGAATAQASGGSSAAAASSDWRGQGPGGLGNDISGMSHSDASNAITARAKSLSPGSGTDAEAPTTQQWGDAKLMGTDITGMSRGQARSALDAHQGWYESRSGGTPTVSASGSGTVGAPADWMPQTSSSPAPVAAGSTSSQPAVRSPGGHSNDGRFMIPENRIHAIGIGGGFGGTGYHGQNWQGVSVKSTGVSALTGQSAARRAEEAPMRAVHFGQKTRTAA